ncbi:hypothetical protein [Aquamicrobium defluvii]|nr:hypothetical protein [Aquamicrobium defluvii]
MKLQPGFKGLRVLKWQDWHFNTIRSTDNDIRDGVNSLQPGGGKT